MVSKLILLCLPFCLGLAAQIDLDLSDLQGDSKAADTFYIRDVEHPVLGPSNCQFSEIKRCNKKFKDNFHNIGTVRNQGNHTVYCNGVQSFVTCLTRSNCRGPFIGNYSYVVLQHAMMDKKLNICPHHRYSKLKTRLKGKTFNLLNLSSYIIKIFGSVDWWLTVEEKHKLIDSISELPTSQKYENDDRTSNCSAAKELDVKMITECCIQNLSIFQEKAVDLVKVLCLDFSSKGLRKIPSATMPNLRYLNISRNPDIKLSQINFITQLPNVSILDLTGNPHWPNVSQITTLRMLNLIRGTPLDDKCLRCYLVKNLRNIDTFLPKAVKRELDTAVEHPVKFHTSCYGNILELKDKSFVLFENIGFKLKCVNLDKRCFQGHADIPFFKGYASVGPLNSCWSTMNNISSPIFAFASIALILNLVVVMVTFRSKTVRQNTAQLLVGVVAVGDLLMGVYLLLITSTRRSVSYEHMTRLQRSHFCYFVGFVSIFGQGISAFSSFIVTIERYLAVVFCLQPDIRLFTPIAHGFIAVIFFLSFVFAILPFTVLKGIYVPDSHCTPVSEPTSEVDGIDWIERISRIER
ncbi:predicted protein [Nematostella vectensis]|uniref:G-protein coupled receptors family 1 profile domain-containing protein n=1 Tax=Nematostella vectensis TaxID=45351 RepID=A7SWP3_NEMVE|nr:predicted protein [Nematostella vectensis]|eukprot:XP_001623970.1 predicted protein [Nematostella vectensis]